LNNRIEYHQGQVLGNNGIEFIRDVENNSRKRKALFKCHCGREFTATIDHVKKDSVVRCGRQCENYRDKYEKGQILGEYGIEFLEELSTKVGESRKAKFKCHCGKEYITLICSVKGNQSKSCGCNQNRKREYIEGQEIGSNGFIFLKDMGEEVGSERKALVRCKCGKEYVATVSRIANGHTKSCGCTPKQFNPNGYKRICADCGKEFFGGVKSKYCTECKTRTCPICGNKFSAKVKNQTTKKWPVYCSVECGRKGAVGHTSWNKGRSKYITIQCQNCNKDMIVKDHKIKKKFCSTQCRAEYHTNLGTYRRSDKPQRWRKYIIHTRKYTKWRTAVLVRDGGICRECWDKYKVKNRKNLEVHHIIPIYADKTKIFKVWNGITLCRKCHKKTINHEAEFSDYYFNLVEKEPIKVNKQWYREINVNTAIRKWKLGYTQEQVAKSFGVCVPTLVKRFSNKKLSEIKGRIEKLREHTFYSVIRYIEQGKSIKSICSILHTHMDNIQRILAMWGENIVCNSPTKNVGLTGNIVRKTIHLDINYVASIFKVSPSIVKRCRLKYEVV
jgi:5-methylcytosine-specific restriction endonuclease McrA